MVVARTLSSSPSLPAVSEVAAALLREPFAYHHLTTTYLRRYILDLCRIGGVKTRLTALPVLDPAITPTAFLAPSTFAALHPSVRKMAIPTYVAAHPDAAIDVHEVTIDNLLENIQEGTLDLAICREPTPLPQGFAFCSMGYRYEIEI